MDIRDHDGGGQTHGLEDPIGLYHWIGRRTTPAENEYVIEENRILRNQIAGRVQLTDAERHTLAAIGKKLGKQALEEVATIVKPDTILA